MNREEFILRHDAESALIRDLKTRIEEAENRQKALEDEYFKTLPYKVGDYVHVSQDQGRHEFTGYIIEIATFHPGLGNIFIRVSREKNDNYGLRFFDVQPDEVEILNEP